MTSLFVCRTPNGYYGRWLPNSTPDNEGVHEGEELLFRINDADPFSDSAWETALREAKEKGMPLEEISEIFEVAMFNSSNAGD